MYKQCLAWTLFWINIRNVDLNGCIYIFIYVCIVFLPYNEVAIVADNFDAFPINIPPFLKTKQLSILCRYFDINWSVLLFAVMSDFIRIISKF